MTQEMEPRKLKIPEFKEGETTHWVNGKDTKSTSAKRRAAKQRFYWVIFVSIMLTVFGGFVISAIIYGICVSVMPTDRDLFTPQAEIVHTFKPEHTAAIQDLIYSPDGLFLITASDDASALILDAETGETLRQMKGHQHGVTSLAAVSLLSNPSDKEQALSALRILTGGKDTRAILWNPEMNPPLHQVLGSSEDTLSTPEVNIFEIPPGHTKAVTSVALSTDGRYALTGGMDNRFFLWDTVNRTLVKSETDDPDSFGLGADLALPHTGSVTALIFSPDGNSYISGSEDCLIKIWDSNSDAIMQTISGHNSAVTSLSFGSSGKLLLSSGRDQRILLWDLITGARKQIFEAATSVEDAALTANEKFVLGTMFDNSIALWDIRSGEKLLQFVTPDLISTWALSPAVTKDGIPLYVAVATVENEIFIFSTASQMEKIVKKLADLRKE